MICESQQRLQLKKLNSVLITKDTSTGGIKIRRIKKKTQTSWSVLASLLLCLLFLGSRDLQPDGALSGEERDDLLKQQDAARHAWRHMWKTQGVNFGGHVQANQIF